MDLILDLWTRYCQALNRDHPGALVFSAVLFGIGTVLGIWLIVSLAFALPWPWDGEGV